MQSSASVKSVEAADMVVDAVDAAAAAEPEASFEKVVLTESCDVNELAASNIASAITSSTPEIPATDLTSADGAASMPEVTTSIVAEDVEGRLEKENGKLMDILEAMEEVTDEG